MRRRRFMRCDRGLRKSILIAFSGGCPGVAAMAGSGYGDSDHETQALDSVRTRGLSPLGNLADCRRWHKLIRAPGAARQRVEPAAGRGGPESRQNSGQIVRLRWAGWGRAKRDSDSPKA